MKSRLAFSLLAFLLGIGATVLVVADPMHWLWVDRARGAIVRAGDTTPAAESSREAAASAQTQERKIKYWRAPMDPDLHQRQARQVADGNGSDSRL